MNTKNTTNPGAEKEKRLNLLAKANLKAGYRIGWKEGATNGKQDAIYDSFISAVSAAELAQQCARDRSLPYTFSVLNGNNETVYTCR